MLNVDAIGEFHVIHVECMGFMFSISFEFQHQCYVPASIGYNMHSLPFFSLFCLKGMEWGEEMEFRQNLDQSSAIVTGSHVVMYASEVTLISIEKDSMMCCQAVRTYDETIIILPN